MSEKQPYQKPRVTSEHLEFERIEEQRAKVAETSRGDIFVKGESDKRHISLEKEKEILKKALAGGVNVEIPFEGGSEKKLIALDSGDVLADNIANYSIEQLKQIFKDVAEQLVKLHRLNLKHGDFHLSNIAIEPKTLKVSFFDFETATDFEDDPINFNNLTDISNKILPELKNFIAMIILDIYINKNEDEINKAKFETLRNNAENIVSTVIDKLLEYYAFDNDISQKIREALKDTQQEELFNYQNDFGQ
ncbi:MAG: lipopolysaccharide kinase InaA family protein [Candidatus Magasanikiibacteriota bacterium]